MDKNIRLTTIGLSTIIVIIHLKARDKCYDKEEYANTGSQERRWQVEILRDGFAEVAFEQ